MKIQPLKPETIGDVVALETECFAHPWTLENIEEHYGNPHSYFFTAEEEGKTVGYIGTYMVMDECFVTNVAVTEGMRGRGIGNDLVKCACENAKANGASFITLEVRISNASAVKIYQKNGFVSEGVRPGFYRDPDEDALIMTRRFK